ncbi:MAG: hypothetical protein AAF389_00045 [Gemmatimonadota bacterium]
MSDNDQVKPYHAKSSAPGQEAADVVAEVLAHAAEREEAAQKKTGPKGPPRWMLPLTVNMGVLALYFLIAQPDFLILNPIEDTRTSAEQVSTTKTTMGSVVASIERFQAANGRLPSTLAETNDPFAASYEYRTEGDSTFVLTTTVGDETVEFNSATTDRATFFPAVVIGG